MFDAKALATLTALADKAKNEGLADINKATSQIKDRDIDGVIAGVCAITGSDYRNIRIGELEDLRTLVRVFVMILGLGGLEVRKV